MRAAQLRPRVRATCAKGGWSSRSHPSGTSILCLADFFLQSVGSLRVRPRRRVQYAALKTTLGTLSRSPAAGSSPGAGRGGPLAGAHELGQQLARMVRKGNTRITAQDIAKAGDVPTLIKDLVKKLSDPNSSIVEGGAAMLKSLAEQGHREHADALVTCGAVGPLVRVLSSGSTDAQTSACSALSEIAQHKVSHQAAIVEAGALLPLVKLLKTGSSKAQEQVSGQRLEMNDSSLLAPQCLSSLPHLTSAVTTRDCASTGCLSHRCNR